MAGGSAGAASALAEGVVTARVPEGAATEGAVEPAPYVAQFQRLYREFAAGRPMDGAEAAARAAALEELAAAGFPLRHDEEWAHTPVRAVLEPEYRLGTPVIGARVAAAVAAPGGVPATLLAGEPIALLTVNGAVVTGDGDHGGAAREGAHPGVRHARWDGAPLAAEIFTRPLTDAFTSLTRAFGGATELQLDAAAGDRPLHLVHLTTAGMLAAPRVRIRIAAGARVTLVETFAPPANKRAGSAPALTCAATEIHLGPGAALTYVRVQTAAAGAFDIGTTTVVQERDSELYALNVALGAELARHTLNVLAAGPGIDSRLFGAAVAGGSETAGSTPRQVADSHTYLEHAAPGCASRQLYKMVLGRGGHGVFSGRILVRPVAQQTDAFQLNQNLLLDDAVVDTKPQLEIGADDVRCSHGATTGRLSEDQLFYLQTRGIPRPAAMHMLARGFLDEVVGDLPAPELRPRLLELLHRRLDKLEWSPQS